MNAPALLRRTFLSALLAAVPFLFAACITEDFPSDNHEGNLRACWKILDEHYCFFAEKEAEYGLNWDAVWAKYSSDVDEKMTQEQLFEVIRNMTAELRDGHVNVYADHDIARYGDWFDAYPANFSDSLQRIYLGKTNDYMQTASLRYKILDDNIGYIRCASFESDFGDGNLHEIMRQLALCDGLILDVRSNGGGMLTSAQKLASLFFNEKTTLGYISHKTGKGHSDFSSPEAIEEEPFVGLRWQKPVCILTNRRTFSAANAFVMFLKGLDGVTIVGDRTGGGAGLPFSSELPNGWSIRFSACPMFDRQMQCTESGIAPDVHVDLNSSDFAKGKDTIIEEARRRLRAK